MRGKKRQPVDVRDILEQQVRVIVDGKIRKMHPFEAQARNAVTKALKGNMRACKTLIQWWIREGIIKRPEIVDEHIYRPTIPDDWDEDEFADMYEKYGPPPWRGERDGLTPEDRALLRQIKRRQR